MGQALYRKYRSKSLQTIAGQEHITKTLAEAIKQGRISHAYLFTGPRGVGKTSVARILAHEINGLPYVDDSTHLDIIEIDAASNRRIDEIRDLREKVNLAPTSAKYKVYIIDEVHMLTREAFNALLKTLEEPPEHVVFILATTDAHKLPETIISRTQRFSFKPADTAETVALLKSIAKEESIKVSDEVLVLIAEHAGGSFRDSVSLLDQASSHGKELKVDEVQRLLGIPPRSAIQTLLTSLSNGATSAEFMNQLSGLYGQGYQAATIAKQLGQELREQLVTGNAEPEGTMDLLKDLLAVPTAHDPARYLEICLLQQAKPSNPKPATPASEPEPQQAVFEDPEPAYEVPTEEIIPATKEKSAKKPTAKAGGKVDATVWPQVLEALKKHHNTLYGVVRMAEPRFAGDALELAFAFPFHQKRINEPGNQQKLSDVVTQVTGSSITITSVVDTAAQPETFSPASAPNSTEKPDLTAISNIFGGGELLES